MTEPAAGPPARREEGKESFAARLGVRQRLGGVVPPILTVLLAFLMGGLIVLATGHNPIKIYRGIWDGTGLGWIFDLPWDSSSLTALNLQQTLIWTTSLILTGLAVAFAFRCGLFNIGGQGQYLVGLIVANWVGVSMAGLAGPAHIALAITLATLAGAVWAGIAGILKATVGAHEVISTIMLNWIAIYFGAYVFGQGGPLQGPVAAIPISGDVVEKARLPILWGDPVLQGLHIGIFIALGALVVFYLVINRTTLGYEVRTVGFNPDAAAYGGISVKRNYFLAMAISGSFAGLAGGIDMLGWQYHFGTLDIYSSQVGFLGIAVALLGRNTALGTGLAALIFGALFYGTTHGIDPDVFRPELAGNLTSMIQGLVVLFVGADILILYLWGLRRKRPRMPRLGGRGA